MIIVVALIIVFLSCAAVFNSEMDTIRYRPKMAWFKTKWWLELNTTATGWVRKDLLSFMLDGWHFCKSVTIFMLCSAVTVPFAALVHINHGMTLSIIIIITMPLTLYVIFGIVFNQYFYN